ncbi:MAG: M56 family metallopeptidase [Eubacteriales bacterium]
MEVARSLWLNNIWPSILSSAFALLVVLFIMQLFSIKGSSLSSNLRFKLLELPLIKAFLVLLGLNLGGLKVSWYTVAFIYGWGVACFIYRWITYEKFKTEVLLSDLINDRSTQKLEYMVENMAAAVNCPPPRLLVVKDYYPSPFVLGFFSPLLVLPVHLVESLSYDEMEALLGHEIAHITRWDNLYIWQAVLFRDIMFFNPVVLFIYHFLLKEKEKNCDDLAISITGKPVEFAEMLLKVYNLMKEKIAAKTIMTNTTMQSLVGSTSLFNERVERIVLLPKDYFFVSPDRQFLYYIKICIVIFVTVALFSINIFG